MVGSGDVSFEVDKILGRRKSSSGRRDIVADLVRNLHCSRHSNALRVILNGFGFFGKIINQMANGILVYSPFVFVGRCWALIERDTRPKHADESHYSKTMEYFN